MARPELRRHTRSGLADPLNQGIELQLEILVAVKLCANSIMCTT
jgi:hypothetical protein